MKTEYNFKFAFSQFWPGLLNMEADRYFGEDVQLKFPFVRFYTWDQPTISYGLNQNIAKRINSVICAVDGIPLVKRPTGGRELLHGHDLCYCVAWPCESRVTAIEAKEYFRFINDALVDAFHNMGIKADWSRFQVKPKIHGGPCFAQVDSGEITVNGKKIVGSAQRVFDHCVIQQGSIPLWRASVDLLKYLNQENRTLMGKTMDELTTFLFEEIEGATSLMPLIEKFKSAFEKNFGSDSISADDILSDFHGNNVIAKVYNSRV